MVSKVLRAAPVAGKVTGFMSIIACAYIVYEILSDKKKQQRTYFRLLLGISCVELCDGVAWFVSSWAFATRGSCLFQGFLLQASVASNLYTAFLALFYLLSIKYNWSERRISKTVEPWMHGIALTMGYGTASASVALNLFKPIASVCYIGRTPPTCKETYKFGYTDCTQGDNASLYSLLFMTIWQWCAVFFTAVSMLLIWCHIYGLETKSARHNFAAASNNNIPARKKSKQFAKQGFLYVAVFYFSQFWVTFSLTWRYYGDASKVPDALYLMNSLTFPLEGFLNFVVYMRPRILKYLRERRKKSKEGTNKQSDTKLTEQHDTTDRKMYQDDSHFLQSQINDNENSGSDDGQFDEEYDLETENKCVEKHPTVSTPGNVPACLDNETGNTIVHEPGLNSDATSSSLSAPDVERSASLGRKLVGRLSSLSSILVLADVNLEEIREDESEQMNLGEY